MIVECYSADVYCDHPKHYPRLLPGTKTESATFTGRNKRSCDKQRREAGWIKVQGNDICPDCKKRPKESNL